MIQLVTTKQEFLDLRSKKSGTIGLVPTMGNLHEGHLSLLDRALSENDLAIMTIFVNPTQFGPNEDFDKYPRTLEADLNKITNLLSEKKVDKDVIVYAPATPHEIYGDNFSTFINVKEITDVLCGAKRPGHFEGVGTVVYKIFSLTKPTKAYFGQKDYQQVLVIKRMTENLDLPIEIITCDIARNEMGLALSSRNQYLNATEMIEALHLSQTLNSIKNEITKESWTNAYASLNLILENETKNNRWDYLEVLDADNLKEVRPETSRVVIAGAYKINNTRLIDNLLVDITYA